MGRKLCVVGSTIALLLAVVGVLDWYAVPFPDAPDTMPVLLFLLVICGIPYMADKGL